MTENTVENEHAILSPSGASRWSQCLASPFMERGRASSSSSYAEEGTKAHLIASECLIDNSAPEDLAIKSYTDYVRKEAKGGILLVERRMSISHITGEPNAAGTGDAVIIKGDRLIIIDLKYGMGLKVNAEDNPQLAMYALAALESFGFMEYFKDVKMVIHQPRLDHVSEEVVMVEELLATQEWLSEAAKKARDLLEQGARPSEEDFYPSQKTCKFCLASGDCAVQTKKVLNEIDADFEVLDDVKEKVTDIKDYTNGDLDKAMQAVPFIKAWAAAVEKQLHAQLLGGGSVEGWKLVRGRRGNSTWTDEGDVEKDLRGMNVPISQIFVKKIISPSQFKKKFEKTKPGWWAKVADLVFCAPGKPTVAAESDKRKAIVFTDVADDFKVINKSGG